MKKIIIVFIFFGCTSSSFAANLYAATKEAIASFNKQYPGALYATWETLGNGDACAVRFVYNNQSLAAYYYEDGTAIGFARIITIDKLPLKVKEALSNMFTEILSAQELVLYDKHLFYFDVLNKQEKFFIGIYDNGKIKQKKKV